VSSGSLSGSLRVLELTKPLTVFQSFGGGLIASAGQSIFENRLIQSLVKHGSTVNAGLVLATGASDLHSTFNSTQFSVIQAAYMTGLHGAFALGIASGGVAFFIALSQPWFRLSKEAVK